MRSVALFAVSILLLWFLPDHDVLAARNQAQTTDKNKKKKERPIRIVYRSRNSKTATARPVRAPTAAPTMVGFDPLLAETRNLVAGETLTWSHSFHTNVSSVVPTAFTNKAYDVLSVRQREFQDIHWHSISYGSGWGFSKLHAHAGQVKQTGLFPTNCLMTPHGIATIADWALMLPCMYGYLRVPPKVVFVHHLMLPHFTTHILPKLPSSYRFVLVSSGTDQTIPTSSGDVRFQPLSGFADTPDGGANWITLTSHKQIIHWFCENHDLSHPKVSTLPVGVVDGVGGMEHVNMTYAAIPIEERSLQFLVAHRLRNGKGPWELRTRVLEQCLEQQEEHRASQTLCISPQRGVQSDHRRGIPQQHYITLAQNASFIACVRGGGLDPSPKAWEAIMLGTIPIIQHSTLDDAYSQLPVVLIDDWNRLFGNVAKVRERLEFLRDKLGPYYSDTTLRALVLERLRTAYWSETIFSTYRTKRVPEATALALEF